jgi:hypothetical protein
VQPSAKGARNYSQCDSMLIGDNAGANTYPYISVSCWCLGVLSLGMLLVYVCFISKGVRDAFASFVA